MSDSAGQNVDAARAAVPMSYAEIVRSGIFVLRALGFSFAIADRAVRSLATTQALTDLGVLHLRQREEEIRAAIPRRLQQPVRHGELSILDGQGKSLLELGAFALDLLTADVRCRGPSTLLVFNVFGSLFAGDLAFRAISRGLALACNYCDGGVAGTFVASKRVGRNAIYGGALAGCSPWPDCLWKGVTRALALDQPAADAMREKVRALSRGGFGSSTGGGALLLVGLDADSPFAGDLSAAAAGAFPPRDRDLASGNGACWQDANRWMSRLASGIREGMVLPHADARYFFGMMARAWLPTSERSRRQNG